MDVKLMKDFEEMEGQMEVTSSTETVEGEEEDDEEFRPAQASSMNSADIFYEMEKRGLKSTGFPDTDIEMLQNAFNDEFKRDLEAIRAQRAESKRRAAQQAGMARRRKIMQLTLQEEQDELAANPPVTLILETVKAGQTGDSLRMDLNSVAARSLAKAMWVSENIICLDLSGNQLNDKAGKYIARILNRNQVLRKMELDNNSFGNDTMTAFGESLRINTSLTYLSLDSNPLMRKNGPTQGFTEFCAALTTNTTLTSANLFRTGLTPDGGRALSAAMLENKTLLFCDIAHNSMDMSDMKSIAGSLDSNLSDFDARSRQQAENDLQSSKLRMSEEEKANSERKALELSVWLDERREERAVQRRKAHDQVVEDEKVAAEESRIKEEKAKAAADKAAAEAQAKKDKKAAKKKKK
jgi:hypothetical protein